MTATVTSRLTCCGCGKPMNKTKNTLPQGAATCHACRRARREGEEAMKWEAGNPERPCRTERCQGVTRFPYSYCEPCRVERSKPKPPVRYYGDCLLCGRHFEARNPRRVFCNDTCADVGKMHLKGADARWSMASVFQGDTETGELIIGPVLPSEILRMAGSPRCPKCGWSMKVVTDYEDYGCEWCYIKVTPL